MASPPPPAYAQPATLWQFMTGRQPDARQPPQPSESWFRRWRKPLVLGGLGTGFGGWGGTVLGALRDASVWFDQVKYAVENGTELPKYVDMGGTVGYGLGGALALGTLGLVTGFVWMGMERRARAAQAQPPYQQPAAPQYQPPSVSHPMVPLPYQQPAPAGPPQVQQPAALPPAAPPEVAATPLYPLRRGPQADVLLPEPSTAPPPVLPQYRQETVAPPSPPAPPAPQGAPITPRQRWEALYIGWFPGSDPAAWLGARQWKSMGQMAGMHHSEARRLMHGNPEKPIMPDSVTEKSNVDGAARHLRAAAFAFVDMYGKRLHPIEQDWLGLNAGISAQPEMLLRDLYRLPWEREAPPSVLEREVITPKK